MSVLKTEENMLMNQYGCETFRPIALLVSVWPDRVVCKGIVYIVYIFEDKVVQEARKDA